jgi:hypothetical protein
MAPKQPRSTATLCTDFAIRTIRLRHRFTTFWRVGKAIHNKGRRNSQFGPLDSQLFSQLLAGKRLEWRSLFRLRHSHGTSLCSLITTRVYTTTQGHVPRHLSSLEPTTGVHHVTHRCLLLPLPWVGPVNHEKLAENRKNCGNFRYVY